ncbi:MAG: ribosomal-processing cysteine protease Prp [Clostridia bacterium]|jgi:uncharacterized protein YsxB (DUF464 family)|nr:ribosomal-processing cysteine protease Prp [Clostridiales bacterium]
MIKVCVKRDKQNSIVEYRVTGHAGYDAHGRDVVCSAVSVLAQAAVIGLTRVVGIEVDYSIDDGDLYCVIPSLKGDSRREADLILDTMFYTLENIREGYPGNILITETEV